MKENEELKKKELHAMLLQGFQNSYEGKTTRLTKEKLRRWARKLNAKYYKGIIK